jgi:hypothetical protein
MSRPFITHRKVFFWRRSPGPGEGIRDVHPLFCRSLHMVGERSPENNHDRSQNLIASTRMEHCQSLASSQRSNDRHKTSAPMVDTALWTSGVRGSSLAGGCCGPWMKRLTQSLGADADASRVAKHIAGIRGLAVLRLGG